MSNDQYYLNQIKHLFYTKQPANISTILLRQHRLTLAGRDTGPLTDKDAVIDLLIHTNRPIGRNTNVRCVSCSNLTSHRKRPLGSAVVLYF